MLGDAGATAIASAASIWEIEIKRAGGRLETPTDAAEMVANGGFERLAISFEHARGAAHLPPHHGDPFDRMLVAQAQIEGLTLATADQELARYDVEILPVTPG